jgi:hypothetical protein
MFDLKDLRIAKMNALTTTTNIHIANMQGGVLSLKDIVEDAEKLVAWILNPELKYVTQKTKETK